VAVGQSALGLVVGVGLDGDPGLVVSRPAGLKPTVGTTGPPWLGTGPYIAIRLLSWRPVYVVIYRRISR